jgi:hypothetical protein
MQSAQRAEKFQEKESSKDASFDYRIDELKILPEIEAMNQKRRRIYAQRKQYPMQELQGASVMRQDSIGAFKADSLWNEQQKTNKEIAVAFNKETGSVQASNTGSYDRVVAPTTGRDHATAHPHPEGADSTHSALDKAQTHFSGRTDYMAPPAETDSIRKFVPPNDTLYYDGPYVQKIIITKDNKLEPIYYQEYLDWLDKNSQVETLPRPRWK